MFQDGSWKNKPRRNAQKVSYIHSIQDEMKTPHIRIIPVLIPNDISSLEFLIFSFCNNFER